MAKFEVAIPHILAWEGGYVWHKDDPGQETNRGITDRLDGKVDGLVDLDGDGDGDVDIKGLTEEEAKQVYKRRFWDKMLGDQINSQQIANILFDGYVNCGGNGIKLMQRVLGVKEDGVFGPESLQTLNECTSDSKSEIDIYDWYKELRKQYYIDLAQRRPPLKVFLKGWLNRIESFPDLE